MRDNNFCQSSCHASPHIATPGICDIYRESTLVDRAQLDGHHKPHVFFSRAVPILYWCTGLLHPKCKTFWWHFTRFSLSPSSRALCIEAQSFGNYSSPFSIIHKFIEGTLHFSKYDFLNMLQYMVLPCLLLTLVTVIEGIVLQSESKSHLPGWSQLSQDSLSVTSL